MCKYLTETNSRKGKHLYLIPIPKKGIPNTEQIECW